MAVFDRYLVYKGKSLVTLQASFSRVTYRVHHQNLKDSLLSHIFTSQLEANAFFFFYLPAQIPFLDKGGTLFCVPCIKEESTKLKFCLIPCKRQWEVLGLHSSL